MLSIIPERDVYLFHEYDRDGDDLEDLTVLPCQVWFDTEAPQVFERDERKRDRTKLMGEFGVWSQQRGS